MQKNSSSYIPLTPGQGKGFMRVQNPNPYPYPHVPLPQTPGGFETLDNPYLRLCLLNRRNAQGCARSKRKACVSESSDGKDKYRKGGSTGGDKESRAIHELTRE